MPTELEMHDGLSAGFVTVTVRHGASVMPPVRRTEVSGAELAAIANYPARKGN